MFQTLVFCIALVVFELMTVSVFITAALTFLIAGTIATWPSPSYPKLKDSLESGVTSDQWAWVVSLLGIGGVITPIPAAYFTERLGRKPVLLACAPFFLLSWLLIIFAR